MSESLTIGSLEGIGVKGWKRPEGGQTQLSGSSSFLHSMVRVLGSATEVRG
jgi:hypothetical protein